MSHTILQYIFYIVALVVIGLLLANYISKAMNGEKVFLTRIISPIEKFLYKILKIDPEKEMGWKEYLLSVLLFNAFGLIVLWVMFMVQKFLPGNPMHIEGMSWDLAFNTAVSFVTNTNWQAYSGEFQLSYLSQALGLTVQNFVSAASGIAVLFALIRGLVRSPKKYIGNFWVDLTKCVMYVLLPLSLVVSIVIASQGVTQSLKEGEVVKLLEPIVVDSEGNMIEDAVINGDKVLVDNKVVEDATVVDEQFVPLEPTASQVAIKQLGTNGGGVYGVNSAHPLENPNIVSNFFEMLSILIIPVALCFSFGRGVKDKKQGIAIFMAMFIMLIMTFGVIAVNEQVATPQLACNDQVDLSTVGQAGGNLEGKESRFGIASSATWATYTTAASNGSVNSMHDSYTPLGGLVTMLQIELGEVIFGGVGCGLYGMIGFVILTVFIAGLMVGRTPEYLSKKIEPYEMKMAVLVCLATPIAILVGSGIAAVVPDVVNSLNNTGAHGLSEMLYAYSSVGGNNGSAFAGFNANTVFLNVSLGFVMLFVRFVPMSAIVAIAGSLVCKKKVAVTSGTLSTSNAMFVFLLILMVLIVGALSFFPALSLGPIAEYLGQMF